ncbi:MAG: 6-bladed beta-propeller [Gemmatimonadota bacterium]|nr:6-bladed beta-propeller [Gemmatimonadota bacterium]
MTNYHTIRAVVIGMLIALPACTAESGVNEAAAAVSALEKGGDGRSGPYIPVEGWWKDHPETDKGFSYAQIAAVAADTPDRIIVGIRGDLTPEGQPRPNSSNYIVVVNGEGNVVERWTQWDTLFAFPHQIYVNPYDPERHIWVVDRGGTDKRIHEQILKFTNDGKQLVMRLRNPDPIQGQGGPNRRQNPHPGPLNFGQVSTMTFLPNGDFLVGDGYQNGRVIRFNEEGEFISEFGSVGSGPGQFDLVHGVAMDRAHRIYVVDRNNSRIQVFTEAGDFIEEWPNIYYPSGIYIDENENVWVISGGLNEVMKFNTRGELQTYFGAYGGASPEGARGLPSSEFPGGLARPHQLNVDQAGNIYIASYAGPWVNKFVPKPGADPKSLIGPPLLLDAHR